MNAKLVKALLATLILVGGASTVTAASSGDQPADEVRIVDEEITISDAVITVSDTTLTGPFASDEHIEDQRYTIDSTLRIDGLHIDHDGTRYTICRVVINVEDVGLHIEDTTVEASG
jgi:hypothetical protein